MRVSIVIPNYNGKRSLVKNLPQVLETGVDEVIVVDDASTDGSVEEIKKFNVKIIENKKNMGFSSTANRGVEEATGEIVVLLNTDVSPEPDFLKPLVSHFADPKVFAVGCMDKSFEDGKIILRGRGVGEWRRGFLVHRRGETNKTDTLWVSGGSGAFRKSLWEYLGGLDEIYDPFYWEDIDLSYRAKKSGFKTLFEPKSIVTHEHQKGAIKTRYSPFQIKTIAYRNQFFFVWKNATDPDILRQHLLFLPYHFLKAILDMDLAFFLGFFQAIFRLWEILKGRKNEQSEFVKTDKEISLLS